MVIRDYDSITVSGRCYGGPYNTRTINLQGERTLTFSVGEFRGHYTRSIEKGHPGGITIGNWDFWWVKE